MIQVARGSEQHRELKDEIARLLVEGHFIRRGEFTLSSGEKSKLYYDIKEAGGNHVIGMLLGQALASYVPRETTQVLGKGMGGNVLAPYVAMAAQKDLSLVRNEKHAHGLRKIVEGKPILMSSKVYIVDDVYTTGGSFQETIEAAGNARVLGGVVAVARRTPPSGIDTLFTPEDFADLVGE